MVKRLKGNNIIRRNPSGKRKVLENYWVQTTHAVIAPDGSACDYYFSKAEAVREARRMNEVTIEELPPRQGVR